MDKGWIGLVAVTGLCLALSSAAGPALAACAYGGCSGALVPARETGAPGDDDPSNIEAALSGAGPGGVVQLCPGKVFDLPRQVTFPVGDVTLETCNPDGAASRAVLRVTSRSSASDNATAVWIRKPGVTLRHLKFRGGGPWAPSTGLPHDKRTALVEAGGANGDDLTVEDCVFKEPLGWSALHLFEGQINSGDRSRCRRATVRDNRIVNAGYPGRIDGLSRWADGISMACEGAVTDNVIINPTDGGIVVFVPHVEVTGNTIRVDGADRHAFGGVNLVDCVSRGNMTNIEVGHNLFEARNGGSFDMAVAVGPTAWFCELCAHDQTSYGDYDMTDADLHHNDVETSSGGSFKYGFVISRVHGLVTRWNDYGGAVLAGTPDSCGGRTPPPNRGAVIASEDLLRNDVGEGVGFWDPSYGRDRFYHLIDD